MSQCGPAKVHRNVLALLYFLKFPSLLVTILPGEKSVVFSVLFLFFRVQQNQQCKECSFWIRTPRKAVLLFDVQVGNARASCVANAPLGTIPNISTLEVIFMKVGKFSTVLKARSKIGFG